MRKGNMSGIWSWPAPKLRAAILSRRKITCSTPSIISGRCMKTAARMACVALNARIDLGNSSAQPSTQNGQLRMPASCRHGLAGAVRYAHRASLESGVDDRKLNGLRGKILPPEILRDPKRGFPARPGPPQTPHRLGLGKFAPELRPRQRETLRQCGNRGYVGRNAVVGRRLLATDDEAIHHDPSFVNPGKKGESPFRLANLIRADQTIRDEGLDRTEQCRVGIERRNSPAAVEAVEGCKMQHVPTEQGRKHRRRGLERAMAPACAVCDGTDNVVLQHLLEKGRGGIPACDVVALDRFDETFRE